MFSKLQKLRPLLKFTAKFNQKLRWRNWAEDNLTDETYFGYNNIWLHTLTNSIFEGLSFRNTQWVLAIANDFKRKRMDLSNSEWDFATVNEILSKHSHIWISSESILSVAHKAMNYFSLIDEVWDNIHRSSQVACVQASPISFDRDDCFKKCYWPCHHQISKTTLTIWFCF